MRTLTAWMFANSPRGDRASAIAYSIVETAMENGLDPTTYLTQLFEHLPNIDLKDEAAIEHLLPWAEPIQAVCNAKIAPPRK